MAARKKFIDVEIPSIESTVGVLGTAEELDKKTIKLDLSRKMRGRGIEIVFKIKNSEGKLTAYPKKIELMKSYIQRMMRKRTNYVEDSFITPCKDIRAIVKPFLITRKKVSRAVRKNLRNTAKEFLIKYLEDKNYLDICDQILAGELQKAMLPTLKKVYPMSFSDIRIFETKELEKAELPAIKKIKVEEVKEEKSEPTKEKSEEEKKEKKPKKEEKKTTTKKTTKKPTATKKTVKKKPASKAKK
tara:strand:+ start:470 stop:1201 length:732 start_codon:yes stop_codon:yes gene_type:complete